MAKSNTSKNNLLILLCLAALLVMIGLFQNRMSHLAASKSIQKLNYLPSGTFLKGIALGYDEAFADLLWVQTVGYFGAHVKTDQDYTWLIHMLRLSTILDPRYESPYEFAGVILPSEMNKVEEGIAFLKEGLKNVPKQNPRYWLQHFYLGFCYMIYKNEPLEAARHFEAAAAYPKSPSFLPLLIGRLYANVNKPQMGIDMIRSILNAPGNELARNAHWRNALEKRVKELMVAQDKLMLENAIDDYMNIYNKKPSQIKDLVDGLILPFIPEDAFGGGYYLTQDGQHVASTQTKASFEIHISREKPQIVMTPR